MTRSNWRKKWLYEYWILSYCRYYHAYANFRGNWRLRWSSIWPSITPRGLARLSSRHDDEWARRATEYNAGRVLAPRPALLVGPVLRMINEEANEKRRHQSVSIGCSHPSMWRTSILLIRLYRRYWWQPSAPALPRRWVLRLLLMHLLDAERPGGYRDKASSGRDPKREQTNKSRSNNDRRVDK